MSSSSKNHRATAQAVIAALSLLVLILTACGGAATPAPTPDAPTATAYPTPTATPTPIPDTRPADGFSETRVEFANGSLLFLAPETADDLTLYAALQDSIAAQFAPQPGEPCAILITTAPAAPPLLSAVLLNGALTDPATGTVYRAPLSLVAFSREASARVVPLSEPGQVIARTAEPDDLRLYESAEAGQWRLAGTISTVDGVYLPYEGEEAATISATELSQTALNFLERIKVGYAVTNTSFATVNLPFSIDASVWQLATGNTLTRLEAENPQTFTASENTYVYVTQAERGIEVFQLNQPLEDVTRTDDTGAQLALDPRLYHFATGYDSRGQVIMRATFFSSPEGPRYFLQIAEDGQAAWVVESPSVVAAILERSAPLVSVTKEFIGDENPGPEQPVAVEASEEHPALNVLLGEELGVEHTYIYDPIRFAEYWTKVWDFIVAQDGLILAHTQLPDGSWQAVQLHPTDITELSIIISTQEFEAGSQVSQAIRNGGRGPLEASYFVYSNGHLLTYNYIPATLIRQTQGPSGKALAIENTVQRTFRTVTAFSMREVRIGADGEPTMRNPASVNFVGEDSHIIETFEDNFGDYFFTLDGGDKSTIRIVIRSVTP